MQAFWTYHMINEPTPDASSKTIRLLLIIGLAFLLIGVGWNTGWRLAPGWSADDGVHLRFSSVYSVREYLFNPKLLWIASYANLTPLLNLFYSFNLHQFGFDVQAWRTTMAAISVLAVLAFYLALAQHMRPSIALFTASAWALSVPFFYTAATFMTSHYMVGMLCASLSAFLFSRWVRQGGVLNGIGTLLFYSLTIFSKEVFVPLLALFLFHKPWQRSLRGTALIALVLPLYLFCRHAVLGSVVGGYRSGQFINTLDWPPIIERLLHLPVIVMGGIWQASIFALILGYFLWRGAPALRLFAIVAVGVVMLPLMPLLAASNLTEPDRYFFVAFAVVLALLGVSLESCLRQRTCKPWIAIASASAVLILIMQQQLQRVPALVQGLKTQAETYSLVLHTKGTMLMLNTDLPADASYWSAVLNGSREAQARVAGLNRYDKVLMVVDPQSPILFGLHAQGVPIYRYDKSSCRCYVPYAPVGPTLRPPG